MLKYELDAPFYNGVEDFTFFHDAQKLGQLFRKPPFCEIPNDRQWDETVCLKPKKHKSSLVGRLNVSNCFKGRFVSCSFRATGSIPKAKLPYHTEYQVEASGYNPNPHKDVPSDCPVRVTRQGSGGQLRGQNPQHRL